MAIRRENRRRLTLLGTCSKHEPNFLSLVVGRWSVNTFLFYESGSSMRWVFSVNLFA
jgi:hypothetical protein